MMEQHPIPQQISSYEFKLVGEMTLKQFIKAAVGVVLALLVNGSRLVFFIKYPLMFIFGAGGLALAFGSFQDRPLETWIVSFIKSIYAPTIYIFKKKAEKNWLDVDMTSAHSEAEEKKEKEEIKPSKDTEKVEEYMDSLPAKEEAEEEEAAGKTEVREEVEELKPEDEGKEKEEVTEAREEAKEESIQPNEETIEKGGGEKEESGVFDLRQLKAEKLEATGKALFGSIPMPDIPEIPNLVVGMVTDKQGKIVEGAIVEVQDEVGNPSRVLKTNALGQFKSSAPLANGRYLIITEKEGLNFDRVNVDLSGQIIQPIKIISL
jgi:hypothetical protein